MIGESIDRPPFFDFYKEAYDREITRKQEIESNASTTVTTLGFLFAFTAFYLLNWADTILISKHEYVYYICAILISLGLISMVIGIFFIARFYLTNSILLLETPVHWQNWYDGALTKYKEEEDISEEDIKKIFFDGLMRRYIEITSVNANNNDKRANYHFNARSLFFVSFVCLIFAFPFYFIVMGDEINMAKMEIHKSIEINFK